MGWYRGEGSERVSRGSVPLPGGGEWSSTLAVPMRGDQSALLTISRRGNGPGLEPAEAGLVIPPGEAALVVALLQGIVAQARADGVLV